MHYTQLFRQLREGRGFSYEALARRARCHRNTVINVERGRPVKFNTLADLMEKMGYSLESAEMRTLALLWLEAVSGMPFSKPEVAAAARKQATVYGRGAQQGAAQLAEAVMAADLTADQIRLLVFAARQPEVLAIIEAVRDLVESAPDRDSAPQLKVAEDK
ncbi:MAG: helix-turn-helix transcriptional regulator [Opitutaceae bacterium]|nr:helix-turn-helix transcriptional regulator [Opitutaceae bacterium]